VLRWWQGEDGLKAVECIVEKGGITWDYDEIATSWALKLVNANAEMRGSNVECTEVGDLSKLIRDSNKQKLLTRPQSRGVVSTIFNGISAVKSETTMAITGLPGIGKSWTLLYVLQQALLYEGVFIMFYTDGPEIYLFHRRCGKLYAWATQAAFSHFLTSEETLAILNPSQNKELDLPLGSRHLIYATSNHEKNFDKQEMKKFLICSISSARGRKMNYELHSLILREMKVCFFQVFWNESIV